MESIIHDLNVPPEYSRYDTLSDEVIHNLHIWKEKSAGQLSELAAHLSEISELSLSNQTSIVLCVGQYDGDGPWVSESGMFEARNILSNFITANLDLFQNILGEEIRPIFRANLHPNINPDTGRKLPRAAGGLLASQDMYTSQSWKEGYPGIANVVLWIVKQLKSEDYEQFWYLIIPPVMTLLDDYGGGYKLQGIQIVAEMLNHVPRELLRRTGVDELIFSTFNKSLKSTLTFLNNSKTPAIIRAAVPTNITLINLMTSGTDRDKGKQRFDQLCSILGEGIIGSVWMYASRDVATIKASIEVLPVLVEALDIGSVRYLKAMIHELVHPLLPPPPGVDPPSSLRSREEDELKIVCLLGLRTVIRICKPRIQCWKGTILDAATRCWVYEAEKQGSESIKIEVKELIAQLRNECPSIIENEFKQLLDTDPIFVNLLSL